MCAIGKLWTTTISPKDDTNKWNDQAGLHGFVIAISVINCILKVILWIKIVIIILSKKISDGIK